MRNVLDSIKHNPITMPLYKNTQTQSDIQKKSAEN